MVKKILSLFVLFFVLTGATIHAQLFFNNGGQVYVGTKSVVQINGTTQNDAAASAGFIWNRGKVIIASTASSGVANSTPGTYKMTNTSLTHGSGYYKVEQDWVNDATFTADSSTVELYGNKQQFITSTIGTVTTFDTLKLTGTGAYGTSNAKKTLQNVDAKISNPGSTIGALYLNDRELATDNNTMFVQNTDVAAVQNSMTFGSEGFVSSLGTGSLARDVNKVAVYKYPTGSSLGTVRYRQADITPDAANAYTFTVRLANNDGTSDGYDLTKMDTSLCKLNNLFYHKINRLKGTFASNNADIKVYYDATADGSWETLAEWNIPTASQWNDLSGTPTTASPYSNVVKTTWFDAATGTQNPIVLGGEKPAPPLLACANVCAGQNADFTATGSSGATFNWITPTGASVVSGQGTNSVTVNWGSSSGLLTVTQQSGSGCISKTASCNVTPLASPIAAFDTSASGLLADIYKFTDKSTSATTWDWNFGDGSMDDNSQNPASHEYKHAGKYTVTEIVTNGTCTDTIKKDITIKNKVFIPNVFTPNKDGQNDNFYITGNDFKDFKLEIYNRWGLKIFEANSGEIKWDGKSSAGEDCVDGTYYFILYADGYTGVSYNTNGFINLIR